MANIKLAEALLRRKELQGKVDRLRALKESDFVQFKVKRINVTESVDEVRAQVPMFDVGELTKEFDFHARQLRLVDAAIQQANWTTEIVVPESVLKDFEPQKKEQE